MTVNTVIDEYLKSESIFDLVPSLRKLLAEVGDVKVFEQGQVVFNAGEPIYRVVIPLSSHLMLKNENGTAIGMLQRGRVLFLRQVLNDQKATYSVHADNTTTAVTFPVVPFKEALAKEPGILKYLLLVTDSSGVRSFKRYLEENNVDRADIVKIIAKIRPEVEKLAAGHVFPVDQPGLRFIDSGKLIVSRERGSDSGIEIIDGMWIGGESVVAPYTTSYHASVAVEGEFRFLPLEAVKGLIEHLQLQELIHVDPYANRSGAVEVGSVEGGEVSQLPGEVLSESEVDSLNIKFDRRDLKTAQDDAGAGEASVSNLVKILRLPVDNVAIKSELALESVISPLRIAEVLEPLGLSCVGLHTNFDGLARQKLPCLVSLKSRLVVLLYRTKTAAIVVDPCRGFVAMSRADFEQNWDGRILEVSHAETDEVYQAAEGDQKNGAQKSGALTPQMTAMRKSILKIVVSFRKMIGCGLVLALTGMLVGIITPKINQFIIDDVLSLKDFSAVLPLVVGSLLLSIGAVVINIFQSLTSIDMKQRLDARIAESFYRHSLNLERLSDSGEDVGEFNALMNELQMLKDFFTTAPLQIGMQLLSIVVYSVLLISYSPVLAGVGLSVLPAIWLLRRAYSGRIRRNYDQLLGFMKQQFSLVTEQITSIMTIKATNSEDKMRERVENNFVALARKNREMTMTDVTLSAVVSIIASVVSVLALWIGCTLAAEGKISVGEVVAISAYMGALTGPVNSLAGMLSKLEEIKISWQKVAEVYANKPRNMQNLSALKISGRLNGKIRAERIGFRYSEDSPWVLKDLDLTIYPRQVVAIVGRSGCGKSTLANLLAGNLTPTSGRLFYDHFESTQLSNRCLRKQIGLILQDSQLFSGTIAENIAFNDDTPEQKAVDRSARAANAVEFINRFPTKYEYKLVEGGLGLSGGQRQRISIARTLYRSPTILLLDEATSALDTESESVFLKNMQEIFSGKTVIIIAHRLSTVRNADRILVMKDGQIVEDGSHKTLSVEGTYYSDLFSDQLSVGLAI